MCTFKRLNVIWVCYTMKIEIVKSAWLKLKSIAFTKSLGKLWLHKKEWDERADLGAFFLATCMNVYILSKAARISLSKVLFRKVYSTSSKLFLGTIFLLILRDTKSSTLPSYINKLSVHEDTLQIIASVCCFHKLACNIVTNTKLQHVCRSWNGMAKVQYFL